MGSLFLENLRISVRSLLANRVRSLLTLLGLVIGIAAVIAIVSAGQGLKEFINLQASEVGENVLYVFPDRIEMSGRIDRAAEPFTNEDVDFLRSNSETVAESETLAYGGGTVRYGNSVRSFSVAGIESSFFDFEEVEIEQGRTFQRGEVQSAARVAIIGHKVREELVPKQVNPIGQRLKINGSSYRIVGLTELVGAGGAFNPDQTVYIPLKTFQQRVSGNDEIMVIYLRAKPAGALGVSSTAEAVQQTKSEVTRLLRVKRQVRDPSKQDFRVMTLTGFMEVTSGILNAVIVTFGVIAVIALLVGGVGVMNIMLVSVTERTSEIGLRKAVGAHPVTIMSQFLIESGLLTLIGGVGGLALGYGLSWLLSLVFRNVLFSGELIPPSIPLPYVLMALGISIAIGLLFGTLPAVRAARMDPVDAIRA